ncbi:aminopeptidase P family protein [Magnetospirillum sp. UT-4]|uniref:aminopeptidase P family protein n=1 Tax=Magnetospirillum sp. UT-4 TaxID=2681467 RepID=UPI00137E7C00|nr:aminopeptidase P family protein [Magnetospirillum sp. UT-4]CAA7624234.1 Peptidase, M24 family protein [Magnetospirillum sp. UT-4]
MDGNIPLDLVRAELARRGLTGFVVPRADEHQGEYVAPSAQRLAWLTGFTGSAGLAVVLAARAAIFVDGRYTLQVRHEVDCHRFEPVHMVETPPARWLGEVLTAGDVLGFDPWLHTADQVDALAAACERAGARLERCAGNPIDAVWRDRPPPPAEPVVPHPLAHAGRSAAEKLADLAEALRAEKVDAVVLTDPASVAWLLNLRGTDVPHVPVALAFAVVDGDGGVALFLEPERLVPGALDGAVEVLPPSDFVRHLDRLAGKRVRVDSAMAPQAVLDRLAAAGARIDRGSDPTALPRACKNPVELAGARAAHRRDGAALARFLAWLDGRDGIDEMAAADRLEAFRAEGDLFRGLSFPTIAGSGPNGAIVHYRSSPASNRVPRPGELFLLDSGAQYLDGTTDVTRTIAVGEPGPEERHRFTLVLKGHIAIARAVFPAGTTGSQLDVLARRALWQAGLDYDHGTGHGVGSHLSVHEGPQRISKSGVAAVALKPGMVLSNEPGYYKPGAYGIRIENLVAVTEAPPPPGAERPLLGFETLTLAPIDRRLVEPSLLDPDERAWLDAYHARVRTEIGPLVDGETRAWLETATAPVG